MDSDYINLDNYHFLPVKERAKTEHISQWEKSELIVFIQQHIWIIKHHLERYHKPPFLCHDLTNDNLFWLIWDLEVLGKPKLAERAYVALIKLGVIKPV